MEVVEQPDVQLFAVIESVDSVLDRSFVVKDLTGVFGLVSCSGLAWFVPAFVERAGFETVQRIVVNVGTLDLRGFYGLLAK